MTTTALYCIKLTKRGKPCRAYAVSGSQYCFTHDPKLAATRAKGNSAGGKARHGRKLGEVGSLSEPITLQSVADVVKLLESEVNAMLALEVSLSRGQTIARLALAFVKCFEVSEIEQRLLALESSLGENNR